MLPQKLDSDIHQFYRIQGAASHLRSSGRMGGGSGEFILDLDAGVG